MLNIARGVKRYLGSADAEEFPVLSGMEQSLTAVKPLEEQLYMCILSEEEIADGASGELSSIRRKMRNMQGKIKDMLDAMIRSSRYPEVFTGSNRHHARRPVRDSGACGSTAQRCRAWYTIRPRQARRCLSSR